MKIEIIGYTSNALEVLYRAYKTCYSSVTPTQIQIPTIETEIGDIPDTQKMIDFIKKHMNHGSVLEHVYFTFAIENVSRSLLAQITRHRIANFSVQSQRFVDGSNFNYVIQQAIMDAGLKERFDEMDKTIKSYYSELQEGLHEYYKDKLQGFKLKEKCNENARAILPNCTTTNIVMTVNLRELRHIFDERTCVHAEPEIRELVFTMMKLAKTILPFADYNAKKCGISCFECQDSKENIHE